MILLVLLIAGVLLVSIYDIIASFVTFLMFIGLFIAIVFIRKKLSGMVDDNIYCSGKDNKNDMLR